MEVFTLVPQQAVVGVAGVIRGKERNIECSEEWVRPIGEQTVTMTTQYRRTDSNHDNTSVEKIINVLKYFQKLLMCLGFVYIKSNKKYLYKVLLCIVFLL